MARKSSLRDLAAKSKSAGLAAANPQPVANRVVELDPALVHAGGIEDRIEVSAAEIERLAESIRAAGQKVPILVRPHPERPGEYQVVAGRRRLAACKHAGISVRAEIQDLDQRDLVLGQAIENIAREDLSYIERARLAARMVDEAGLQPSDIDMAFGCGKTDRSRYLKIGRGVPDDILQWIGKAPSVGRPRWEAFAAQLEVTLNEQHLRRAIAKADPNDVKLDTSDKRFAFAHEAAKHRRIADPKEPDPKRTTRDIIWNDELNKPLARLKKDQRGVQLRLSRDDDRDFADWVFENPDRAGNVLLNAYKQAGAAHPPGSRSTEDIYVGGINGPAARITRSDQGVELTLIGERRAGFLDYVAKHGFDVVRQMMRQYERDQDLEEMAEGFKESDDLAGGDQ